MGIVEQYLLQLNTEKRHWRKAVFILTLLSVVVALTTTWSLRLTGITIANSATCQQQEHLHTDECLKDGVVACGLEEHVHKIMCYSDPSADVETAEIWEATIPELTGHKPTDIVLVAQSQLGTGESETNYQIADDGETKQGITRYGQWYGNPYGDWANMFTSFCLRYAGIADAPMDSGAEAMRLEFEKNNLYCDNDYNPSPGDVVFLDKNQNGTVDTTAIVVSTDVGMITAIEGDVDKKVCQTTYEKAFVSGYGITAPNSTLMMYAAAPLAAANYTVWLDGTNGGLMSLMGSDNKSYSVTGGGTIKLPTEWKSPGKYQYVLRGWYDVKNSKYYAPGTELTINENLVFYADWISETYNVGKNNTLVADTLSTNDFITTRVFDYNPLFNVLSEKATVTVSSSSHTEDWQQVTSGTVPYKNSETLNFDFLDYDGSGDISYAKNRGSNNQSGGIYTGLYSDKLAEILFDTDNELNPATGEGIIGKHYVGTADHLFQENTDPSDEYYGYYYYDSKLNAASYNQSDGRFYVYNYLERTADSDKDGGDGKYSDFLPFNSPYANTNGKTVTSYSYNGEKGEYTNATHYQYDAKYNTNNNSTSNVTTNYNFGMSIDIDFYLPNKVGYIDGTGNSGNRDVYGNEMHFFFSGDDDVWVLLDGKLVLDIGGVHGIEGGDINFSTGTITINGTNSGTLSNVAAGDHTLTVYYLERGSSQSNCSIYFNLAPRFLLTIQKEDVLSRELLNGAQFSVFSDFECTKPAQLWQSAQDYHSGKNASNVFTVENGKATLWGFASSNTYYIRETRPPDKGGYTCAHGVICLTLDKNGVASYSVHIDEEYDENGNVIPITNGFTVHGFKIDEETQEAFIIITNGVQSIAKTTSVFAAKQWNDSADHSNDKVIAYLNVTDEKGNVQRIREVELSKENNWQYTWGNLPKYYSDGVTEINYSVTEAFVSGYYSNIQKLNSNTVTTVSWQNTTSFTNGEYILNTDNGCLSAVSDTSDKLQYVSEQEAKNSSLALWTVKKSGNNYTFTNKNGQILTLKTTSPRRFYVTKTSGSNQSMTVTTSNSKLILRSGNYYACTMDSNGYLSANSRSNTSVKFSPQLKTTKTITYDFKDTGFLITNTPIEVETSVTVKKEWLHPTNNTALYENEKIVIRLFANGVYTGRTVTLDLQNDWSDVFDGLPYTDEFGEVFTYTVEEEQHEDWIASYGDVTLVNGNYQVVVTNHYRWTSNVTLPATGGTGPPIYILIGVVLVIIPFVYVFNLRRRCYERRRNNRAP